MVLFRGKKWSCYLLVAHLIFAIVGTLSFSTAENLELFESAAHQTVSGEFFSPPDTTDWLIEDTVIISGAGEYSPSPLRNGTLRIIMPSGVQNARGLPAPSPLRIIGQTQYSAVKNTILVKLRI
jgi:hypothetical protein